MKTLRMIGLALFAALALSASVGAGSALASDTTLCKTNTNSPICLSKNQYPASTSLFAKSPEGKKFTIVTDFVNMECTSTMEGKTGAQTGNPLSVSISKWSFINCGTCLSPSLTELPSGSLRWGEGADGTLELKAGSSQPQLKVKCAPLIDCTFSLPNPTFKGGSPAQLVFPESSLSMSGENCPKSAHVKASLTVSSPEPAYVATTIPEEAHTRLCKKAESPCSEANTYPYGTMLESEASKIEILTTAFNISCSTTKLSGKTTALGAEPLPFGSIGFSSEKCGSPSVGPCTVGLTGSPTIQLAFINSTEAFMPFLLDLQLVCKPSVTIECTYRMSGPNLVVFHGGEPATFAFNGVLLELVSTNGWCPTSPGEFYGSFSVKSPKPLYAT